MHTSMKEETHCQSFNPENIMDNQEIELQQLSIEENCESDQSNISAQQVQKIDTEDNNDEELLPSSTNDEPLNRLEFGILSKLVLFEVALMLFDTASDMSIVVSLYNKGFLGLSLIGLFIDLLPGLTTTLYMSSNGYGWKSLLLLVHPWNIIWHCFWSFYSKPRSEAVFHKKIFMFSKACQSLLESPLQIIFTTTLIAHGVLQLPWKKEIRIQVKENSVDLSLFLSLSIIFSLLVIIKDFSQTTSSLEDSKNSRLTSIQKFLTWMAYFASAILFRLEVWVLLLVYYIELTSLLISAMFLLNLVIIYFLNKKNFSLKLVFDSVMSIVFPTAFTSTANINEDQPSKIEEGRKFSRKVHITFGITGNLILCKLPIHQFNVDIG